MDFNTGRVPEPHHKLKPVRRQSTETNKPRRGILRRERTESEFFSPIDLSILRGTAESMDPAGTRQFIRAYGLHARAHSRVRR